MLGLRATALRRDLMAVAGGAAAGQLVAIAFSPLLTRIYSPESFGLQGVFLSLISILGPAIALRYPMAIVVAETDDEARQLAQLSIGIAFILSILLGLALLATGGSAFNLSGAEGLGALIWLLPLALFFVALQEAADFSAARLGSFRLVGLVNVNQVFLMNLARVMGGLVAPVAGVLVAVTTFAPAVQAAMLRLGELKRPHIGLFPTPAEAKRLLRLHSDFALYWAPNDVLNSASQTAPVIMLAALYSPAAAGYYTLARAVLNLPTNVIGTAFGNVLYARFAELARDQSPLTPLVIRATFVLAALAPAIIGLAWFAPMAFSWVFGQEWREAGYYARWIAISLALSIIAMPLVRAIPVIGRQRLLLDFNIVLLAIRILSVTIAFRFSSDALFAVIFYSISSSVMIISSVLIFFQCLRVYDRNTAECGRQFK